MMIMSSWQKRAYGDGVPMSIRNKRELLNMQCRVSNEVEAMLKRLKVFSDVVEEHWIVKQEQQDVTKGVAVVHP